VMNRSLRLEAKDALWISSGISLKNSQKSWQSGVLFL
jgi:hypothetical protein